MALATESDLKEMIRRINDESYLGHEGFPETNQDVADRWSEIIDFAASGVIPVSTTVEAAKSTFISDLKSQLDANNPIPFVVPYSNYATTLASGMTPSFVGVVPSVPISFSPVYAVGFGGGSAEDCAELMAGIIINWFKTGTATPSGGGSPINWS